MSSELHLKDVGLKLLNTAAFSYS